MNRNLHIERVYSLGDYKSIRFSDTVEGLPADVMFNNTLIEKIRFLQMVSVDTAFQAYKRLNEKTYALGLEGEDIIAYLEEVKLNTLAEIKTILNGNLEE